MDNKFLREICKNCGLTFGAHCGGAYYSDYYAREIPSDCCPGHEGRMDWDKSPETIFAPSGEFKDVAYGTAAKGGQDDIRKSFAEMARRSIEE